MWSSHRWRSQDSQDIPSLSQYSHFMQSMTCPCISLNPRHVTRADNPCTPIHPSNYRGAMTARRPDFARSCRRSCTGLRPAACCTRPGRHHGKALIVPSRGLVSRNTCTEAWFHGVSYVKGAKPHEKIMMLKSVSPGKPRCIRGGQAGVAPQALRSSHTRRRCHTGSVQICRYC